MKLRHAYMFDSADSIYLSFFTPPMQEQKLIQTTTCDCVLYKGGVRSQSISVYSHLHHGDIKPSWSCKNVNAVVLQERPQLRFSPVEMDFDEGIRHTGATSTSWTDESSEDSQQRAEGGTQRAADHSKQCKLPFYPAVQLQMWILLPHREDLIRLAY